MRGLVVGLTTGLTNDLIVDLVDDLTAADLIADLTADLIDDLVGEPLELVVELFAFDFLEPNTSPQTLFSIVINVSFIAVFAILQFVPLQFAFLTHDKISLLHCLPLVFGEPQH